MTTEADKTVAELMALADAYSAAAKDAQFAAMARDPGLKYADQIHAEARIALEQAIRRAVDFEPVAEVGPAWSLVYVGSAPVAEICRNHPGLRIGTPLYARNKP